MSIESQVGADATARVAAELPVFSVPCVQTGHNLACLSVCVCVCYVACWGVLFHSNPLLKVGRPLDQCVFQLSRNPHTCEEPRCVCVCAGRGVGGSSVSAVQLRVCLCVSRLFLLNCVWAFLSR